MSGQALGQREDRMTPKRIPVGHDGSPAAERVVSYATCSVLVVRRK